MSEIALLIRHKTRPGKRDEVVKLWERHLRSSIADNPAHEAYSYCLDNGDEDSILALQQYTNLEESQRFLAHPSYLAYLAEVESLLARPPEVTSLTPLWRKGA